MKKIKIVVAILLILTFAVSFVACTPANPDNNGAGDNDNQNTAPTTPDNGGADDNGNGNITPDIDDSENIYYNVNFDSMGGSEIAEQEVLEGETIIQPNNPTKFSQAFDGWYTDTDEPWNFANDRVWEDITLFAKWKNCVQHDFDNDICAICGIGAKYTRIDENTIWFGSYPQTMVFDYELNMLLGDMVELIDENWTSYNYYADGEISDYMWYQDVVFDGEKYRGVYFTEYRPEDCREENHYNNSYQDDNGYYAGNLYWFKYEPISWTIIDGDDHHAFLLCDMIIDSQQFNYQDGELSNNYAESTIRRWLNDTFYNTAFNELQQSIISITTVDNSASSTDYSKNEYACLNTIDKLFLLSYKEVGEYFYAQNMRRKTATDYAKSQGISVCTNTLLYGNSYWGLRSPKYTNSKKVCSVGYDGDYDIYSKIASETNNGIVPALWISL